jgi:hypothetical protein
MAPSLSASRYRTIELDDGEIFYREAGDSTGRPPLPPAQRVNRPDATDDSTVRINRSIVGTSVLSRTASSDLRVMSSKKGL